MAATEHVSRHALGNEADIMPPQVHPDHGTALDIIHRVVPIDGDFLGKDVVSIDQFTAADVALVMAEADEMAEAVRESGRLGLLHDKVVANLFFEPSTRTFLSFEAAAARLGAGVISTQGVEFSSMAKGESLEDTIKTVACYADLITLRHSEIGAAAVAASVTDVPIINGGDGAGEHPTQALLDWYTILNRAVRQPEDGLAITLVGDLKNGRTVHSLARLASLHAGITLQYLAPPELQMPRQLVEQLDAAGVPQVQVGDIEAVLKTDVIYATRVQKERFEKGEDGKLTPAGQADYEKYRLKYTIDPVVMSRFSEDAILLHPLPRNGEISPDVDSDPRAVYFDQAANGMYVRMALQALIFGRGITRRAAKR